MTQTTLVQTIVPILVLHYAILAQCNNIFQIGRQIIKHSNLNKQNKLPGVHTIVPSLVLLYTIFTLMS